MPISDVQSKEKLLDRPFYEGIQRKEEIEQEIQRLIKWTFDDWNKKLRKYNESVHSKQAFSAIERGTEQENYFYVLKMMEKHVKEYVDELEYLNIISNQKSINRPKGNSPEITVLDCASSDKSFEVHLTGRGFPSNTNTVTKVMFPDFSSVGSISFKTDLYGHLRSFFSHKVDLPEDYHIPSGKYIVNVFVGDEHEKTPDALEAWTEFRLPYKNESAITLDPIPDVPCGKIVTVTGRLFTKSWSPKAHR